MKEARQFREALGLTQEEAAQLLKIPKSRIGMFEIGQRELPVKAKLRLVTLYHDLQKQEALLQSATNETFEKEAYVAFLELELLENQFNRQVLERKLEQSKEKYQKSLKLSRLTTLLEQDTKETEKPSPAFMEFLKRKARNGMQKHGLPEQAKLALKLKSYHSFQQELEKELKQYRS
ncbi:hypothetical protein DI487_09860 [Flavobacterium sediminis]|uniref:HTH cro/C1-type domain-containing protein n=1 Tax=Flavobacterium sediminis TaxID=2201181 RepID=A0A2U8QVG9_9FLAO|nr:helix-turn-helix transcriptional regulator [Flavobacterium sediminis]AWM14123.1 hypothetical protein DI487_09860 [Flavobacterium sediminis]